MKTAIVKSKNDITKEVEIEGTAILLNPIDHRENETFYELKFIGRTGTSCRWVPNESIKEEDINARN